MNIDKTLDTLLDSYNLSSMKVPARKELKAAIHKAFKDAGYVSLKAKKEKLFAEWNYLFEEYGYMTGEAWLERFTKEINKPNSEYNVSGSTIEEVVASFESEMMEAAKRASGVCDD